MDLLCFLFSLVFAMSLCAFVYMCFVVTCWERAVVSAVILSLPIGILGQVWYLIVSFPDLCTLTYFYHTHLLFLFCLVFAASLCASVCVCFVVTFWERADLLALVCCV